MSTSKDLFCPQTGEAVALFRLGDGNYTPAGDYSNQVLFHFLSYHEQLSVECTFEVRSVEKGIEDRQPVNSLEDLEYLKQLDENITTVLVWDSKNYQELGSRIEGVVNTLAEYDFGYVTLTSS
ncbi:hypothetical protein VIBNISOn1_1080001 [Vibrio nigripulchritudo SOn1]|uniref:Uncharacterized protein n=1 Tax=Vibrio nigripulchritudo SOn1 TaxID=1238450 RepID=A0AAV2VIN1_9VIBR|nr:hypothetical protein [Vibrio nigripulchritudo]CCO44284.1 hypothetical protein VIBNISOn1_1080001 [Vibrio nigripulchritudo SOn1]